jgi:2-keto-4-pentenoate hydratase/2-oxohepta-3-ene-1,7-dioic acid hydratase in catechol pathway
MSAVIAFRPTPALPVAESNQTFPVGRIYCVGRNYAEHAREMGHDPEREPPFFFMKPAAMIGHPAKGAIWLKVNGRTTQQGDLSEMIWNVPETISYLSRLITLHPGDLIMSGTPAGVGPVRAGDRLEGHVDGVGDLTVAYAKRSLRMSVLSPES